jgi:3-oxoadipate enol-lactonase
MDSRYGRIFKMVAAVALGLSGGSCASGAEEPSEALDLQAQIARSESGGPTVRRTGFVEVNGARFHYEKQSHTSAARPPLVLVHGLTLDSRMWDPQLAALSLFFTTYRFDLRGHGQSSPATGPVALHDDLLGFLDVMAIDRAHLVGLSLGGNAVTEVAAAHPERVAKVVLIDSGINGFQYPTPNVLQRIPSYLQIQRSEGPAAALQAWVRDPLFAPSFQNPRVRPLLEAMVLDCPCSLFFNPQFQIRPDTFNRLSLITAPTLVLVGELDQNEFQAAASALDQLIPHSTKKVIAGAGHMANLDRPLAVTLGIVSFLLKP